MQVLAISGGGATGAFGAGVVTGWSARGDRPVFDIVSGVSIGALIAPLVFLGEAYDPVIEAMFADGSAAGVVRLRNPLSILASGALDPRPLERLIAEVVDARVLARIAGEHRAGRRLLVVTTNLDSQRGVIWDLGAIAASGHPEAPALFRRVLRASAALPGAYEPVRIEVAAAGRAFEELHVDGGVTANVLVVPEALLDGRIGADLPTRDGDVRVIVNGRVGPDFEVVADSTLPVVVRSFETAVKANTQRILEDTRAFARRRGLSFSVASIGADLPDADPLAFDREDMRDAFAHGYARALAGTAFDDGASPARAVTARR